MVKSIVVHKGVLAHTVRDKKRWTLLHEAAYWGQLAVAKWLVGNAGVEVDVTNKAGDTPLHFAARQGQTKFAQWLVDDVGANIFVENKRGITAYKAAAKKQHFAVCEFLMERRAVQNVKQERILELREQRREQGSKPMFG
jgi:ankyrin repeat protein